jgi:hypothetical protein
VGGGALDEVGAGAVVPEPVVVVVAVPVVGEAVVPMEGAGEEVGETSPVLVEDADGVGLAWPADDVGEGVDVGLDPGAPPDGDGVAAPLPPTFVRVVPDSFELPRGWPSASSETDTTAIAATNTRAVTAAMGRQCSCFHQLAETGPASGSRGTAGGTAAGSCAEASRGPVPLPAGLTTRTLLTLAARVSEVE